MPPKILFVDDDPDILEAYKRTLRRLFRIEVAAGGKRGLEIIDNRGPFAVIVSDLRMPGMDGFRFLHLAKGRAPDSVRMMITGYTHLQAVIESLIGAVNEGSIFRFITKPCSMETLVKSLTAGMAQYRLVTAERQLLEKTLIRCIEVLTEILALKDPASFGRATRLRHYVRDIALQLQLPDLWQFEMAAMLSQIGCVTLPPDTLEKIYAGESVSDFEQKIFSSHPSVGRELLANIPRFELIAHMIAGQQKPFKTQPLPPKGTREHRIALGAQILKAALDFDRLAVQGKPHEKILSILRWRCSRGGEYNPEVVAALETLKIETLNAVNVVEWKVEKIDTRDLQTGMVTLETIRGKNGCVLIPSGQKVTYPALVRLRNFIQGTQVVHPSRVRVGCRGT